jgi:hypothetical protein
MLFYPKQKERLDRITERLRLADEVTPGLMAAFIADACVRIPLLNKTGKAALRLTRLIKSEAWIDAAFAIIELELPQWNLRRLLYDDGKWFCSLSRHRNLPIEFDDTVDAGHEVLPLALLSAFVEALGHPAAVPDVQPRSVPQVQPTSGYAVCCDNFG